MGPNYDFLQASGTAVAGACATCIDASVLAVYV